MTPLLMIETNECNDKQEKYKEYMKITAVEYKDYMLLLMHFKSASENDTTDRVRARCNAKWSPTQSASSENDTTWCEPSL